MSYVSIFFSAPPWRAGFRILILASLLLAGPAVRAQTLPSATNLWRLALPSANTGSAPALAPNGTLYTGLFDGSLLAVAPDGTVKWRFRAGREIQSSPAIGDDGTIYFGSRDRHFYAVTPAGTLKWQFATGAWVDASPALAADGTIYFGSWDKNFYALRPDGSLKWKFKTGALVDSSAAVAADGTIYFGSHDRNFYALNPDGALRWKFLTGGEIVSSPAIGRDGAVYFTALDGNLYALNPDGTERWRYHSGSPTKASPVLDAAGNVAIGHTNRTEVISFQGQKLWHRGSPVPIEVAAAAVPGRFYVSAPWRALLAVEPVDHALWTANLADNVTSALTVGGQGTVYVNAGNALYAFRPPGEPLPPADSPWPMFRANARHTGRVAQ